MSTNPPTRPAVLVAHPWMGRGGSEATAMWMLQALQDDARLSLVTASEVDLDDLNATYGTSVSAEKVTVLRAPRLPGLRSGTRLVRLQSGLFEDHCRKLAPDFDLCASAYNPVDFGRPGLQMVGDLSFSEAMRLALYPADNFYHRRSLLRRIYLAAGDALRSRERPPLAERGDLVVANSRWVADLLRRQFHLAESPVVYPPVRLPGAPNEATVRDPGRDPLGFVWMGRISPEKKVENLIAILDEVRSEGFPVRLQIAGTFVRTRYGREIRRQVDERRDWITAPGFLNASEKQALLASQSFSLHCNEVEPFGIAVAEMAAAGCLPFVPASGGGSEIVGEPELQFDDPADAVAKITALLKKPERAEELRVDTAAAISRFSETEFMRAFRRQVDACLQDPAFAPGSGTAPALTPPSGEKDPVKQAASPPVSAGFSHGRTG